MRFPTFTPDKNEKNKKRSQIEVALLDKIQQFNLNKVINHKLLNEIMTLCETYISSIAFKERKNFYLCTELEKNEFRKKYPNAEIIIQIQRDATRASFLPEEKSIAKSRWSLLRNLLNPGATAKTLTPGMRVKSVYWQEFRYKGNNETYLWVENVNNSHLASYAEMLSMREPHGENMLDVLYANDKEQKKFLTSFDKIGLLVNAKGKLVDTTYTSLIGRHPGYTLYVYTKTGLYVFHKDDEKKYQKIIKHSSFLCGHPVLCAGMLKAKKGKILEISNMSGHYQPTKRAYLNFIKALGKKADMSDVRLKYIPWRAEPVSSTKKEKSEFKTTKP